MPKLALAGAALMLACCVAGCGHTRRVGRGRVLLVTLTEYRIDPQSVVARAGRLTIEARNFGRRTHNVVVSLNGRWTGSTAPIWPGAGATLTVYLAPGRYRLESTILNDLALGTYGTLVVR